MSPISRRDLLTWFALTPTVPFFVRRSALAATAGSESSHDGRVVVVLRLRGGNDGLNTVVPVRDDRYHRARPTIAIPARQTLRIDGSDLGLNPELLLGMDTAATVADTARGPRASRLDYLRQVDNGLAHAARQLRRARAGTGGDFGYPDTAFGQSLRWTGDMIETGCPTRVYYASIGSFDTPSAASFDTHVDQLAKHRILFTELGRGLRAFARHLRRTGQLDRVLLLTFFDFGRLVAENRSGGTEHGDAGVLFVMGGRVRAGLLGEPADLGKVTRGGLDATVDFRDVYADVLRHWLGMIRPGSSATRSVRSPS